MLLPIGDDNTKRISFPTVTVGLIVINVAVFFLELVQGDDFVKRFSLIPSAFQNGGFPVWSIFTAMFLHAGWAHLLGNMIYLYVFGDNVEDNFGHLKFLIFYLACGVIAFAGQIYAHPTSNISNLGASGAISGVLAAYLFLFPKNKVRVLLGYFIFKVNAWVVLGLWALMQLFAGYSSISGSIGTDTGGIAYVAHVSGFVTGAILVFVFRSHQATEVDDARFRTRIP
jgi:membrane associated rhomboid family serine protease